MSVARAYRRAALAQESCTRELAMETVRVIVQGGDGLSAALLAYASETLELELWDRTHTWAAREGWTR
jgi:hypothetical protein